MVRARQTKSRDSLLWTNSVGLKSGFLACFACSSFSSTFADIVDRMVLATGTSMASLLRLPLGFILSVSDEVLEDEEELEEDEVDDDDEEESESVSESSGWPWMLPV